MPGEGAATGTTKYALDLSKVGDKEKVGKFYKLLKMGPEMGLTKLWESLIKSIQGSLASANDDKIFRVLLPNFLGPITYVTLLFCGLRVFEPPSEKKKKDLNRIRHRVRAWQKSRDFRCS